jgi:metal-responsive CopG/Arc/MetJ family transcriptional regulator
MPTLIARQCSAELLARVQEFQAQHGYTSQSETIRYLIQVAINHLEARSAGAQIVNARMTPAQRSARARKAVAAREAKRHRTKT